IIAAPWVTHHRMSGAVKIGILALSALLAAMTKRLVEDPVRRGAAWRSRRWPAFALAAGGVAAVAAVTSGASTHLQNTHAVAGVRAQAAARALLVTRHRSCFGAAAMLP